MGSLEELDSTLLAATRLLDAAAAQVRDLELTPVRDHIRLIAEAPSTRIRKPGTVTVAGKPSLDVPPGTLNAILKQAGLKKAGSGE